MGRTPGRQVACLLWVLLFGALHVQDTTAQTVVSVPADKTTIQNTINAQSGNDPLGVVIQIAGGLIDLGPNFIKLNKAGVSLRGSTVPANPTIFGSDTQTLDTGGLGGATSCLTLGEGVPMLQLCQMTGSSTQRIVIENIIFRNTRPDPFVNPVPFQKAMLIAVSGTAANPSIVRNCRFENIWQYSGGQGIGIEMQTGNTALHWIIQGNVFDGTRQGVFLNDNDFVQIIGNTFTRFWTGVRQSASDVSTNLVITDNSFVSEWPAGSTIPLGGTQGIALAAASTSSTQDKQWVIQNNKISGVETGLLIRYPTSAPFPPAVSMVGVVISTNSIEADFRCPACANVVNQAAVQPPLGGNWWGTPNPSPTSFYPPLGSSFAPVSMIEPWIVEPGPSTCPSGPGFCPSDPIYNNDVVPVIVSVVINPPTVSAGQSFTVTVTLAQAVAGTLRFTSAPLGVSCPTVTLSVSDNPITVTCTAPQAATVQIAGASGSEGAEGASQAAAGQAVQMSATATAAQQPPTADASVQVADDIEAHAAYQPGSQGGGAWPRFVRHQLTNQAATRVYTITAIVTADRSATKAGNLMVCDNEPWPFTAEVGECQQCSYSCGTRKFSCVSCSCSCPRYDHPYVPAEEPYEGDHEERNEYADKESGYEGEADADRPSYGAGDGGGKPKYTYSSDKNEKDGEYDDKAPYSEKSYDNKETAKEGQMKYGGKSEEEPLLDEHHAYEDKPRYEEASHGHRGYHGQNYENEYDGPPADKAYAHHRSHQDSYVGSNYAGKGEYRDDEESYSKHRYQHSSGDQGYGEEVELQGYHTPDPDCYSDTAKKCVCGPSPLIVPAGCKKVTYNTCDNTLRCSEEAHY